MKFSSNVGIYFFIIVLILFPISNYSNAQSYQMPSLSDAQISMEFMKPNIKGTEGIKTLSSVWFLNFRIPTGSSQLVFLADIPFSNFMERDNLYPPGLYFDEYDGFMVGNPLLAIEFESRNSQGRGYGVFGVRLPVAGESSPYSALYGSITDYDRFEAFFPNHITVLMGGGGRFKTESTNFTSDLNLGIHGLLMLPTGDATGDYLFAKYYLQMWMYFEKMNLNFSFSGIALLSESGLSFGQRTDHQFGIGSQLYFGRFRPGAFIRFPVGKDLNEIINFVGGINLAIILEPPKSNSSDQGGF